MPQHLADRIDVRAACELQCGKGMAETVEGYRAGEVIAASVVSGGDECMRSASLRAARNSTVNIDETAPVKQNGTITYIFIPQ